MTQRHKRFPYLFDRHREAVIADMVKLRATLQNAKFDLVPSSQPYETLQDIHAAILRGFDALGYDWRGSGASAHTFFAGGGNNET